MQIKVEALRYFQIWKICKPLLHPDPNILAVLYKNTLKDHYSLKAENLTLEFGLYLQQRMKYLCLSMDILEPLRMIII